MAPLRLFAQGTRTNAASATYQLLQQLQVPVTVTTVREVVEFHPDADSLYSISDALRRWQVDALALEVDKAKLHQLPVPFVAFTTAGGGKFKVVSKVEAEEVLYINDRGKLEKGPRTEFENTWNGVALLAERGTASGEPAYGASRRKEQWANWRIPLFIAALALLAANTIAFGETLSVPLLFTLMLLKGAGVVITGLLLWYELDSSNPALQQVCNGSAATNCAAVLQSGAAKLFNRISWSEIGFGYFAGGFLLLLFGISASAFTALAWLNLLALPYTLFSVWYQWRVARQWCPLCLAVQALLLAEGLAFYFMHWSVAADLSLTLAVLPQFLFAFALPLLLWYFTKPAWLQAGQTRELRRSLARIKYNPEVFGALLTRQKQLVAAPEGLGIILGNPGAANTIIKVCNPYCGPCAKAHPVIEKLLRSNENLRVQIIFTATGDEGDYRAGPVRHLMALQEMGNHALLQQALDDWYGSEEKDYDAFAAKYLVAPELLQGQTPRLAAMHHWCNRMEVLATPTFFVNGYQLPDMFQIEDLEQILL